MATQFLERRGRYNVYTFECPRCEVVGEIGVPYHHSLIVRHECGVLFIQQPPIGMFGKPKLIEVLSEGVANA